MAQVSPCGAVAAAAGSCAAAATGRKTAADRGTAAAADQEVPRSRHLQVVAPREAQR